MEVEGGFDHLDDLERVVVGLSSPVAVVPPGPVPGLQTPERGAIPEPGAAGDTPVAASPGMEGGRDGAPGSPDGAPGRGGPPGRLPAPVLAGAVPVRLADVATVTVRRDPPPDVERLNGRDGLGLVIYQEPGANTVSVSRGVREALSGGLAALPGWQATVTYDAGLLVERAVRGVGQSLLVGSLLAVAILWLFLRRGRAVAVVAVAIPISACATLAAMHLAGMTLNVMSLGGLALSAGVLVDQAIVVLESIAHRHRQGLPPREAAEAGTAEVAAAVAGSTVTNLIVFLPVLFLGGLAGQLFHDLAVTNALAQAASLLVAVTVVPVLAAWWLDEPVPLPAKASRAQASSPPATGPVPATGAVPAPGSAEGLAPWAVGHPGPDGAGTSAGTLVVPPLPRPFEACLARPAVTLVVALVLVAASVPAAARLGTEFLPAVDERAVDVTVTLPQGSSLAATTAALERVEAAVLRLPGVETVVARAGGAAWPGMAGAQNQGLVRVQLAEGAGSSAVWAERIRRRLDGARDPGLDRLGAQVTVQPRNLWADVGAGAPVVELALRAEDPATLAEAAAQARRVLAGMPGLADVAVDLDPTAPRLLVRVDAAAAAGYGLAPAQVGQQLRLALAGEAVARARVDGRWLPVVLRTAGIPARGSLPAVTGAGPSGAGSSAAAAGPAPAGDQGARPALGAGVRQLPLAGGTGWTRLDDLATVRPDATPAALVRRDGWLSATVTARVDGTDLGTAVTRARQRVAAALPPGAAVAPAGTAVLMEEGFATLVPAALGALLLIYMAMAAQFESLVHPLLMMVTLPLALVGAVAGLAVTGHPIGLTAVMGGIVLAGIAVNNGIVLVDAARRYRAEGLAPAAAIRQAWRRRLRPVLMTALTTLLGSLPMVLAPGRGSELEVPLAAVLVGGLFTSTALTLVVLPCAWLVVETRRRPAAPSRP